MRLNINDYDYLGRGISRVNNKICFIPKTLLGEIVLAKLVNDYKTYSEFEVESILKKSDKRITSYCPYSNLCGGCTFDICSYIDGIKIKESSLKKLFNHNNIDTTNFKLVSNPFPLNYRNKISLKVENGCLGFYKENTHDFVKVDTCPLASQCINKLMKDFSLFKFLNGELIIRCNRNEEILLIIKTNDEVLIKEELTNKHKIAGIIINDKCIYNDSFLYERRNGLLYKVSFDSFFQVNPYISEIITHDLLDFINPHDKVLDLYCGVGYLSLKIAKKAYQVIGIEVVKNAILNAIKNKELNHLDNVSFHLGKVENVVEKMPCDFTKVVVDPPRNGLDKKTIKFLLEKEYESIIYVSCNPLTLVRDINKLKEKYEITFIRSYDMFSYTKHVECVCILKLR